MAKTTTPRLGQTRWSSGTDTVRRLDFDTDAANLESLSVIYGQGLLSARPTAGKAGRFYAVTGEGNAALNGRIFYDNGTVWTGPRFLNDGYSEASAAGNTALTVKAAASQTADIFKVTNNGETSPFVRVTSSGVVSNQTSLGVSGGFYLGFDSTHDAAASLISVGVSKPVLTVKAITSQTASLIVGRDASSATVFSVSPAGNGVFAGSLQSSSLTVTGTSSLASLTTTGALNTKNLFSSPVDANGVAATFAGFSGHLNNIVAFTDSTGARLARVSADGTFATNTRVVVGPGQGNLADPSYASNTASLWVKGGYSAAAVARFVGNDAQSGNLLELASGNSGNPTIFSVDNTGNAYVDAGLQVRQAAIIGSTGSPTTLFDGRQPKLEVNTGNTTGSYDEAIVLRHPQQSSTPTTRRLGIYFKLSNETSGGESAKWAGVSGESALASAATPDLSFWSGNTKAGWFSGVDQGLNLVGNLNIPRPGTINTNDVGTQGTPYGIHWVLAGNNYSVGVQPSTIYHRGANFAWYFGGSHSDTQFDPGSGGQLVMKLNSGSDPRLTVRRLTVTDNSGGLTPSISVGDVSAQHLDIRNDRINSSGPNNATTGTLNLQPGGGILALGAGSSTEVRLDSRVLYMGSNKVYWGFSTFEPGGPVDNDWWFDGTNEQIKVRTAAGTWKVVAA